METSGKYEDLEIINKVLGGEFELFEILIRRYNGYLYKIGRSYNYNHQDTQDLMQDSYIDAYTHLSKFENRSSLKTWMIRIMLNNCYQKQRKSGFKQEVSIAMEDQSVPMFQFSSTDTHNTIMNKELNSVIEHALQKVPLDYRMVFSLREMTGLNVAETAEALSISEANVKVRLTRAKAMLRKEIEKTYTSEDIFEFNLVYCDALTNSVMNRLKSINK